jgi:hypothetical protein
MSQQQFIIDFIKKQTRYGFYEEFEFKEDWVLCKTNYYDESDNEKDLFFTYESMATYIIKI